MTTRQVRIAEWVGLTCVTAFYLQLQSGTWQITPDSVDYVEVAKSLAQGRGLVDANGLPLHFFPPGTPLLYSVAAMIPSADYWLFNFATKLWTIGFIALGYLVVKHVAGPGIAAIAALSLTLHPFVIGESMRVLSDMLFGLLLMTTLWAYPADYLERLNPRKAIGLGLLLLACCLIRSIGVTVWLGYSAWLLTTRAQMRQTRGHRAALLAGVMLPALLWLAFDRRYADPARSYQQLIFSAAPWVADSGGATAIDWVRRVYQNSGELLRQIYFAGSNYGQWRVAGVTLCALIAIGAVSSSFDRKSRLILAILFFYFLALLATEVEPRYLLPILGLLILLIVDGTRTVARLTHLSDSTRRLALVALIVIVVPMWHEGIPDLLYFRRQLIREQGISVVYRRHEDFITLVHANVGALGPADLVATMHPNVLKYFVPPDLRLRALPILQDTSAAYRNLKASGVTYLFCDKAVALIWKYTEPMIRAHPAAFQVIADTPTAAIYRVVE